MPYRTADGFLAVGAWQRSAHAELERLMYHDDDVVVHARLFGMDLRAGHPELVLTRRGDHAVTVIVSGDGGGGDGGDDRDGSTVRFTVATSRLTDSRLERYEDWDVSVRAGPDSEAVVARLMDDVIERKRTYVYPQVHIDDDPDADVYEETPAAVTTVRPYLTIASGLAFVVVDRAP